MNPALPICMFSAKENASEMIFVWAYSASHDYCDQSVLNMDTVCYDTMIGQNSRSIVVFRLFLAITILCTLIFLSSAKFILTAQVTEMSRTLIYITILCILVYIFLA